MENEALAQEMLAIFDNSQPQNTASKVSSKMHICFEILYVISIVISIL